MSINDLDGAKVYFANLESNSTLDSPIYNYMCVAFVGRAYTSMFFGARNGVKSVVSDSHITASQISENQFQLANSGYTCNVMFIYK